MLVEGSSALPRLSMVITPHHIAWSWPGLKSPRTWPRQGRIRIEWHFLYIFSSEDSNECKEGMNRDDAWVTKSLGTSPAKLPQSAVGSGVIFELVILIPGLVSQAQGLSSYNGSCRGSPQCAWCSPWSPHTGDIRWPLDWSGILGESYNHTSHSYPPLEVILSLCFALGYHQRTFCT